MVCCKGEMEDEISKAMIKWEKNYMGRGSTEAKADILRDMVIVSLKGVLSAAERHLANAREGMALIKKLRLKLVEQGRPDLESVVSSITSAKVISLHTDISTKTGERIIIFVMDREL